MLLFLKQGDILISDLSNESSVTIRKTAKCYLNFVRLISPEVTNLLGINSDCKFTTFFFIRKLSSNIFSLLLVDAPWGVADIMFFIIL